MEISKLSENSKPQEIKNYNLTSEEFKKLFEKNKKLLLKINRFKNNNLLNYNNLDNKELEDITNKYIINQKIIQNYKNNLKTLEKLIDELKTKRNTIENNIIKLRNKDFTNDNIKEYIEENYKLDIINRKINKIKSSNDGYSNLPLNSNYNNITVLQEGIDISKYKFKKVENLKNTLDNKTSNKSNKDDISTQENRSHSEDILYGLNLFNKSKTDQSNEHFIEQHDEISIKKQDGESIQQQYEESTQQQDGESTQQQDGESIQQQYEESTQQQDGESIQQQYEESTQQQDGESIQQHDEESTQQQDGESIQQQDGESAEQHDRDSAEQQDGESAEQQDGESTEQQEKTDILNINKSNNLKKTLKKSTGGYNLKSILKRKNSMKNNKHIEWNNILPDGSPVVDNSINDTEILNGLTDLDLGSLEIIKEQNNEVSYEDFKNSNNQHFHFSDINEENQINEDTNSPLIPISEIPFLDDTSNQNLTHIYEDLDLDIDNKVGKTNNVINVIKQDY